MDEGTTYARRYAKACDACHKKKIRCILSGQSCQLCTKLGQTCRFTRIEKSLSKRPRRGKYLAALEDRMKTMEGLLREGQGKDGSPEHTSHANTPIDDSEAYGPLAATINGEVYPKLKHWKRMRMLARRFAFPPHNEALHLAQGYFASYNQTFPIFSRDRFMHRIQTEYPPQKKEDLVWYLAVCAVLTFAHRLRAMSAPALADEENDRACPFISVIMEHIPVLTYMQPTLEAAQVLLATATVLRGTPMPHHVPMLVSTAIRMLQCNDAHLEEEPGTPEFARRTERIHTFWTAYILDKDIGLQFRKPPVLHEQDIGRVAVSREVLEEGVVRSLDASREANLFAISQSLAMLQGQVWSLIYSGTMAKSREALEAAQDVLNPRLAAWKDGLPFRFHRDDLVGKWPKHAIVNIVTLHFRYFHTLVELNKEPPYEPAAQLRGTCPLAKSLPKWPHSTSRLAVQAARDALDLAALTPRGNFQNVWAFFDYSLSAMLTLLVNGIVRPLEEHGTEDLKRVDAWLRVTDILATESERPDLLEKKEFILHMRDWTMQMIQSAKDLEHVDESEQQPALYGSDGNGGGVQGLQLDDQWFPDFGDVHADVFPLPMVAREGWEPWSITAC